MTTGRARVRGVGDDGKPIDLERLAELPATRYSIEGARIVERQRMIPGGAAR